MSYNSQDMEYKFLLFMKEKRRNIHHMNLYRHRLTKLFLKQHNLNLLSQHNSMVLQDHYPNFCHIHLYILHIHLMWNILHNFPNMVYISYHHLDRNQSYIHHRHYQQHYKFYSYQQHMKHQEGHMNLVVHFVLFILRMVLYINHSH